MKKSNTVGQLPKILKRYDAESIALYNSMDEEDKEMFLAVQKDVQRKLKAKKVSSIK